MHIPIRLLVLLVIMVPGAAAQGTQVALLGDMVALRQGEGPEWTEFAPLDPDSILTISFEGEANRETWSIEVTQYDVRRDWSMRVNGEDIGTLYPDEQLMTVYRDVPPGILKDGTNVFVVAPEGSVPDDVKVGRIKLHRRSTDDLLSEGRARITVIDAEREESLPSRITVVDEHGALQELGASTTAHTAVRPGTAYVGKGEATFGLPSGRYTVYASRGFEYDADSVDIAVSEGDEIIRHLTLRREVDTEGWAAMDTHVHTLTYSGHGDATAEERVLTLAGEGVEIPVITEHNENVDLTGLVEEMGYGEYVMPIVGNEYTTPVGHFNVFPVGENDALPDPEVASWPQVAEELERVGSPEAAILNHARDVHADFRPFGPKNFHASVGRTRGGEHVPANAMEVINSSAQQSDVMQLVRDWFGTLSGGAFLTPVGSSDSHDVARYVVGQGRTYVNVPDDAPSAIDAADIVRSFRQGKVTVSYGLMTVITVDGEYGPGEIALPEANAAVVRVEARVLGPSWVEADTVRLYMNGVPVREENVGRSGRGGEKWSGTWTVPVPSHDVYLSAVALGPGDTPPFWPVAKPYQSKSPQWHPRVLGVTGAVWIDGDGDGRRTHPQAYAERIVKRADGDVVEAVRLLAPYDEAVAAQVAAELYRLGHISRSFDVDALPPDASDAVRIGFRSFLREL